MEPGSLRSRLASIILLSKASVLATALAVAVRIWGSATAEAAPAAGDRGPSAAGKPNVLLIIADDLNNSLGCYGHPVVQSPNIDRLAKQAVRFDRAYCQYPVCNPSRASFLSGLRPDTTRIVDNATPPRTFLKEAVFLPQHFRANGYFSWKVGKIFHTGDAFEDPPSWDIDVRERPEAKAPPPEQVRRRLPPDAIVLQANDDQTWDGLVARQAAELMQKWARAGAGAGAGDGKPFFLAVGFRRPHAPYLAPEKYFGLYDPKKLQARAGPPAHLANIPQLALTYRLGEKALPADTTGQTIAAYYASISFMDAQVGVLLETLDRLSLWDRTIVVFLGDHGYHLGEHGGLWHKMTLFEEACRVPLLVAAPGKAKGANSPRLVELIDLYPTLAALCGLPVPAGLEGTNLVALLENPAREWKKSAVTVVSRGRLGATGQRLDPDRLGRSVRTEEWRYTEWPDGTAELYDHRVDPHEYVNLARNPTQSATVARLKQFLSARPVLKSE